MYIFFICAKTTTKNSKIHTKLFSGLVLLSCLHAIYSQTPSIHSQKKIIPKKTYETYTFSSYSNLVVQVVDRRIANVAVVIRAINKPKKQIRVSQPEMNLKQRGSVTLRLVTADSRFLVCIVHDTVDDCEPTCDVLGNFTLKKNDPPLEHAFDS